MTPGQQLDSFIAKFTPEVGAVAQDALKKMRKRFPGAIQLVYDNYNALAIGFGPSERASEAIFSIALYPRWVSLFFLRGAGLPDPQKRLKGSGNVVRYVVLESAATLDAPAVQYLMNVALHRARKPIEKKSRGQLIIKSISAKQRPRRPTSSR